MGQLAGGRLSLYLSTHVYLRVNEQCRILLPSVRPTNTVNSPMKLLLRLVHRRLLFKNNSNPAVDIIEEEGDRRTFRLSAVNRTVFYFPIKSAHLMDYYFLSSVHYGMKSLAVQCSFDIQFPV